MFDIEEFSEQLANLIQENKELIIENETLRKENNELIIEKGCLRKEK